MADENPIEETTSPVKDELIEPSKNGATHKPSKADELFTDSDDDPFSDIECDLCSKQFNNVKMYDQHLKSKKHHQMLTQQRMKEKLKVSEKDVNEELETEPSEEIQCDVCEKSFSSYIPYTAHIKGSVHAKNVRLKKLKESLKNKPEVLAENNTESEAIEDDLLQKPFARCLVCSKVFYDPSSYQQHMRGAMHKKKVQNQKICNSLKDNPPENPGMEDDELFSKCDVCNKSFSGPVPYQIHLKSAVHENQVKRTRAMEELKNFYQEDPDTGKMICKECKRPFTDPFSFKQHLDNNMHERQSAKEKVIRFVTANPEVVAMKSIENISSGDESDESGMYEKGYYFLVCKLCHVSFSGVESAKDHVQSKKHLKTKKEKNEMKKLKKKLKENHKGEEMNGTNGQVEDLKEKKRGEEMKGTNGHTEGKYTETENNPTVDAVDGVKKPKKRLGSDDFELV